MEVKVFLLRTCVNIVCVAQPPSRSGVGAGVLPLYKGCWVSGAQGYECRNKHRHTGRGGGDGPGAVPGEAPHRHKELHARVLPGAAPGLKLQQADIQRGGLAQTAAGQSRAEGAEVSGIEDEIRDEF